MKKSLEFLKTTLFGGVLVLIPFLLFYMLFNELVELVIALVFPILDLLPGEIIEAVGDPIILAVPILILGCFTAGLALRSEKARFLGNRFEDKILNKLPMYRAVKRLARGILGDRGEGVFTCGIVEFTPGVRELVYIAEDHGNGYLTIMTPLAPAGFSGSLKIVESNRVKRIEASVGDASIAVSEWGVGLQEVMDRETAAKD